MTTSRAAEVDRRRVGRPHKRAMTFGRRIAILIRANQTARSGERIKWPSARYRDDPVAFAHDILGIEPWSAQVEILEALRDHPRVAVKSGHKTGKSNGIAIAALWLYSSYPDAQVVLSSTTDRQVNRILWRELTMLRARGGRCLECKREIQRLTAAGMPQLEAEERVSRPCPHSALIDGEIGKLARTGLESEDYRSITGFTAREAEAIAGISGKNLWFLLDEASGIPDEIFEAYEGNRAGGARVALFSNPTRTEGEFFDAFNSKKELYHCITVSSASTPNVVQRREVIPGLAGVEWIEEKKKEWGEGSPQYRVRVEGEFPVGEDGKIFSLQTIMDAEARWQGATDEGRLWVGLDPAGESGTGDETCFCPRRGKRVLRFDTHRGLDEYGHLLELLLLLVELREDGEKPVVVVDIEGAVGAKVHTALRDYQEGAPRDCKLRELLNADRAHALHKFVGGSRDVPFELVVVRSSERAKAKAKVYQRLRDRLCGNLEEWMRGDPGQDNGGAIPEDAKLSAELHVLVWDKVDDGPLRLLEKREIRKILGRSPDRYDALALAVWEPRWVTDDAEEQDDTPPESAASARSSHSDDDDDAGGIDPYARPLDPYRR